MTDLQTKAEKALRAGQTLECAAELNTLEYAQSLDNQDKLRRLRNEFIIPTKGSLKKKALDGTIPQTAGNHVRSDSDAAQSIYLAGNSLGVQPKAVRRSIEAQLETWASMGVKGHFSSLENSPFRSWQEMADQCAQQSAHIVGAFAEEVVVMNTLTANLHFLMASFYRPTAKRHKIILEWKPFPSDWYVIQSQIVHHELDPANSMIEIQPDATSPGGCYIPTSKIVAAIDEHADETALILLPGIQYYSGQLYDIPTITAHAQAKGIIVGWDLAHAVGNVPLKLHDWDVDFAAWCTYKYLNAGPGAVSGAFVHERHGKVEYPDGANGAAFFRPRLSGWYGNEKATRFEMAKPFRPTPGAAGYQVGNPSVLDLASLSAALSVFEETSMEELREKALMLTAYAERLLDGIARDVGGDPFTIITPRNPAERGSQLSVFLNKEALLERVSDALERSGIVCDMRKPNVIRMAPVPMYCTFEDVWRFMQVFEEQVRAH